jgi:hypothetical protein
VDSGHGVLYQLQLPCRTELYETITFSKSLMGLGNNQMWNILKYYSYTRTCMERLKVIILTEPVFRESLPFREVVIFKILYALHGNSSKLL